MCTSRLIGLSFLVGVLCGISDAALADATCVLGQQGTRIAAIKERCKARFRITELGEGALRGVARIGDPECAKREVVTILMEIVVLSGGKQLSFDEQWHQWCEGQHEKFERIEAKYFTRRKP